MKNDMGDPFFLSGDMGDLNLQIDKKENQNEYKRRIHVDDH